VLFVDSQIWEREHADLLPRVQLLPGDMFDAATVPAPPAESSSTAYVLRNILHDWPDAECISILKAIRSRQAGNGSRRVKLLVVEVTTTDEVLPCQLPHRYEGSAFAAAY
jgi:hypothetical protein